MRLPMAPQLYLGLLSRSDLCQVLSLRALPRCNPPRGSVIAQTRLAVALLCWPVEVYRLRLPGILRPCLLLLQGHCLGAWAWWCPPYTWFAVSAPVTFSPAFLSKIKRWCSEEFYPACE